MDAVRPPPILMTAESNHHLTLAVKSAGQRLMRFIRARVANEADAEDVLQDVWHRLANALNAGPVEQVGAWLYTVAQNRIIDRYRKPAMPSLDALVEDMESEPESGLAFAEFLLRDNTTPRTEHLRHRFWEELHRALAELPEEQRQVFVWHELEALSFQDIAFLTGENANTLLSRKRYAVLHLRTRLEPIRHEFLAPDL